MNQTWNHRSISTLEDELAEQRPFGQARHINALIDRLCIDRLILSEQKIPLLSDLLASLRTLSDASQHRILRDPIFRLGTDQALLHSKGLTARYSLEWTERLFERVVKLIRSERVLIEAEQPSAAKLASEHLAPLLWHGSTAASPSACIEELVLKIVPDACIDHPSQQHIATLRAAIELLRKLLPQLTASVLNHVVAIVLVSDRDTPGAGHSRFQSGTFNNLPGVMVISTRQLNTPWQAAETLLHEALHLKFIDLEFTHSMNLISADDKARWKIQPPWHQFSTDTEGWIPIRAMTAAHVYLGLALLFSSARQRAMRADGTICFSAEQLQQAALVCNKRADCLLDSLHTGSQKLGLAGQHFIAWLKSLTETHRTLCAA